VRALDHASDEAVLKRTLRGDETAFQELYLRHLDTIFRFAYRMLGSPEHAEDIAHDCFLGLIRNPGRFDPRRGTLRTYLYMDVGIPRRNPGIPRPDGVILPLVRLYVVIFGLRL
jgi:DNA-directed RNA polymerase sigma subunit (sigma70/sigma32)